MRKKLFEAVGFKAALAVVGLFVALYGISWLITCGVIKLVTWCFGWTFSWKIATGIWLVLCLLESTFKTVVKK